MANTATVTFDRIGRAAVNAVAEVGLGAVLFAQSVFWTVMGSRREQPVRLKAVVERAVEVGILALPIVTLLSFTIGLMLAMQGIYQLRRFGAEDQVVLGVGFAVLREFGPLITGILVAGRTGSSLAARIGTMKINQEVDALTVMGVDPVRFIVAPAMIAMMIMVPLVTFWADMVMLFGAWVWIYSDLGMSLTSYITRLNEFIGPNDLWHGLFKSLLFAILITLVGVMNGSLVTGGAEGVGKMTTRSVVIGISAIIVTDMIFVFITTR